LVRLLPGAFGAHGVLSSGRQRRFRGPGGTIRFRRPVRRRRQRTGGPLVRGVGRVQRFQCLCPPLRDPAGFLGQSGLQGFGFFQARGQIGYPLPRIPRAIDPSRPFGDDHAATVGARGMLARQPVALSPRPGLAPPRR
jgi:hypothetical protein